MSTDAPDGRARVDDEEGYVDKQRKKTILEARERIDHRENELFQYVASGRLDEASAMELWHDCIRRFLVRIEPLLRNEEISDSGDYYNDVLLGNVAIPPPVPDRGDGWRLMSSPQVRTDSFNGLRSVIEFEPHDVTWTLTWQRTTSSFRRSAGETETTTTTARVYIPRDVLRRGVRAADEFLENAGIGLELAPDETEAEFDYSDLAKS